MGDRYVRLVPRSKRTAPGRTPDLLLHQGDSVGGATHQQDAEKLAEREWDALARYHAMRHAMADVPAGWLSPEYHSDEVTCCSIIMSR